MSKWLRWFIVLVSIAGVMIAGATGLMWLEQTIERYSACTEDFAAFGQRVSEDDDPAWCRPVPEHISEGGKYYDDVVHGAERQLAARFESDEYYVQAITFWRGMVIFTVIAFEDEGKTYYSFVWALDHERGRYVPLPEYQILREIRPGD